MDKEASMSNGKIINDEGLDILFRSARTYSKWQDKGVSDTLLQAVYDLTKMGATSSNCCPARFVFVKSPQAKEKLKTALAQGNIDKVMNAPVTVIIAQDMKFYEELSTLFPPRDIKGSFESNPELTKSTAFRNSSLQGAYLMLAARSLGLDCGPMSGFDNDKLDELFFQGTSYKSNFICNLGYGDESALHPRLPRLSFDKACRIE